MKIIQTLTFAIGLASVVFANATPGSIGLVLNDTSVNHLIATFIPILAYYSLNNKTIDIDYEEKTYLYKFDLKSVHLITVTGFTTKIFEQVPGTDKIHIKIGGININMDIDGELDALYFIPFKTSRVNITDLTIDLEIESTSDDQVHWQLSMPTAVTVGNVEIIMENKYLNELVKLSHTIIEKLIDSQLKNIQKIIDQEITQINKMIANESDYTFDITAFGKNLPLNMTMTTAPIIQPDSNLIQLNFDGLFNTPQQLELKAEIAHDYFPQIKLSHRNQFWLHQNTLNSLWTVGQNIFFPIRYDFNETSQKLLNVLPELGDYYGKDCKISALITMQPNENATGGALTLSMDQGIQIGNNDDVDTTISLLVKNSTTEEEEAIQFMMNMKTNINFTMFSVKSDIIFFPSIKSVSVENTAVKMQKVDLNSHNFDAMFKSIFKEVANEFNIKHAKGVKLGDIDPDIAMISGLLKNTTLSPYIADGWIYAGFDMQADLPIQAQQQPYVLNFLQ